MDFVKAITRVRFELLTFSAQQNFTSSHPSGIVLIKDVANAKNLLKNQAFD